MPEEPSANVTFELELVVSGLKGLVEFDLGIVSFFLSQCLLVVEKFSNR